MKGEPLRFPHRVKSGLKPAACAKVCVPRFHHKKAALYVRVSYGGTGSVMGEPFAGSPIALNQGSDLRLV